MKESTVRKFKKAWMAQTGIQVVDDGHQQIITVQMTQENAALLGVPSGAAGASASGLPVDYIGQALAQVNAEADGNVQLNKELRAKKVAMIVAEHSHTGRPRPATMNSVTVLVLPDAYMPTTSISTM